MTTDTQVVIVGGGIMGVSLAWHLTRRGWRDVVLLEKNELTAGSTWHAAGLCTHFAHNATVMEMRAASVRLYRDVLPAETGESAGFHACGALRVTRSAERMAEFRHVQGLGQFLGHEFRILTPDELARIYPLARMDGLLGAIHEPNDGHVDPTLATTALAAGARSRGAAIRRHEPVRAIERDASGAWVVHTGRDTIRAEHVVNAAGTWCREIGAMMELDLPVVPMLHQYLVTAGVPELSARAAAGEPELPIIRDPEESWYVRQERDGFIVGPYEPDGRPWGVDGIPPEFGMELLPPDLDRVEHIVARAMERVPALANAGIKTIVHGPITFTPDASPLVGPAFGLDNAWLLTGSSMGVMEGGGAGRFLADWMVDGAPPMDALAVDPRRFGAWADRDYRVAKAVESFGLQFGVHYPFEERPAGRPRRVTPIHEAQAAQGAVFGCAFGWERPNWFASGPEFRPEPLSGRRDAPSGASIPEGPGRHDSSFDTSTPERPGEHDPSSGGGASGEPGGHGAADPPNRDVPERDAAEREEDTHASAARHEAAEAAPAGGKAKAHASLPGKDVPTPRRNGTARGPNPHGPARGECTFGRPAWRDTVAAECLAVRDRAGLVDLSAFAKFEVAGADATAFMQRLGANRPPRAVGRIGLTHVLTEAGGVASELTVTRLAANRYYLTGAAAAERHDEDVLRRHAAAFADVEVRNRTEHLGVLGLAGPAARTVLGALTDAGLDDAAFPWLSARTIRVGAVEVRALRVSYVGELGWELHVAMTDLPALHETLCAAGDPLGLKPFGAYAMNSMRLEKGYRAWGADLTTERTPIESGLGRLVRTTGREFTGRTALLARAESAHAWRMVLLSLEPDADADPFYTHTVWRDGQPIGIVTSGAPGHRTDTMLALAYLRPESTHAGAPDPTGGLEVSLLGRRRRARVLDAPPYDPADARLRGGKEQPGSTAPPLEPPTIEGPRTT